MTDGTDHETSPGHGPGGHDGPPRLVEVSPDAPQFQVSAANPKQVEAGVAVMFVVGLLGFVGFGVAYWQNASNFWLGMSLTVGFFGLGIGMVGWGKYLMPQGPFSEERHQAGATVEEREAFMEDFTSRGLPAIERRGFLLKILGAAGGVFGIVAAFPLLRSLGPLPKKLFYTTPWRSGSYLVTADGRKVHESDLDRGGALTVFPESDVGGALSQTLLIRVGLASEGNIVTGPDRKTWGPKGYLAFSKVCTHAGCPVALYQQALNQLLCPCHQSVFDVSLNQQTGYFEPAMPIFGPAPRPLPQLPLWIDRHGYLRAQNGYNEPVGPGFFERDNS
jgi:ubiquinol-cytochrome c reductase iron-sulfur subunit